MPQPTPYDRQNSFTLDQQENPSAPLSGADVDAEFNALKVTIDEILSRLELIQRDDGRLANQTVGPDQLAAAIEVGVNPPTAWAAQTVYTVFSTVFDGPDLYRALEDHTSGDDFDTDLAAGKWELLAEFLGEFDPGTIEDGSVTEAKLANGAVSGTKLANGAVSAAKLGESAVTSSRLQDGAVTADKIGASAVTADKISTNAVTSNKIQDEAVTYAKIQAVSATDKLLGRSSSGAGVVEEITCTAAGRALLDDASALAQRATLGAAAKAGQTDFIAGVIAGALSNRDWRLAVNLPYAITIQKVTTRCVSGTCTATFKIGSTALGGTANSVSSTENAQTHSSSNAASGGDDLVVTISSNSSCVDMSFMIEFTRTLA